MYVQWKNEWTTPAIVGVVSFAAGVGAGWLACRKKYDADVELAIASMNETLTGYSIYDGVTKGPSTETFEFPIPSSKDLNVQMDVPVEELRRVDLELSDAIESDAARHANIPEGVVTTNVFQDDWDVAEEMANRSPDAPYVIHLNEWVQNEHNYAQQTLEWFEGDRILADEKNVPIYAPEKVVGKLEWGRGSQQPNTVYIRNDRLHAEYEIVKNDGYYTIEVLGHEAEEAAEEDELKHSNSIRRFRRDMD